MGTIRLKHSTNKYITALKRLNKSQKGTKTLKKVKKNRGDPNNHHNHYNHNIHQNVVQQAFRFKLLAFNKNQKNLFKIHAKLKNDPQTKKIHDLLSKCLFRQFLHQQIQRRI